jgi:hypothetical protein
VRAGAQAAKFDKRVKDGFSQYRLLDPADLKIGQDPAFKLMEFQVSFSEPHAVQVHILSNLDGWLQLALR